MHTGTQIMLQTSLEETDPEHKSWVLWHCLLSDHLVQSNLHCKSNDQLVEAGTNSSWESSPPPSTSRMAKISCLEFKDASHNVDCLHTTTQSEKLWYLLVLSNIIFMKVTTSSRALPACYWFHFSQTTLWATGRQVLLGSPVVEYQAQVYKMYQIVLSALLQKRGGQKLAISCQH